MANKKQRGKKVDDNIYWRGEYQFQVRLNISGRKFGGTFESLECARKYRDDVKRLRGNDRALNKILIAQNTTLREVLVQYRQEVTPHKASSRGEVSVFDILEREFDWLFNKALFDIDADDIAEVKSAIKSGAGGHGPRGNATVNIHLSKVSLLFEWSRSDEGLRLDALKNPCASVKRLKKPRHRNRRVSHEEVQKLIAEAALYEQNKLCTVRARAAIIFQLETGLRPGEVGNVRWKDIDWKTECLFVAGNDKDDSKSRGGTKNGEARTVILSPLAMSVLVQIVRGASERVFGPSTAAVCKALLRIKNRAGLDDFRSHDFRHEYVSSQFELGRLTDMEIAGQVGHSNPTTLAKYAHLRAKATRTKLRGVYSISGITNVTLGAIDTIL